MEDKLFNLFNNSDGQVFISYCPVCNLRYNPLEAKVLEEGKSSHLLYVKCRNCQSAVLALVVSSNLGLTSVGLITDLNSDEVLKFKDSKSVNYDEILEFHQFINKEKALINHLD
jgi:hypothetical protein